MKEKMTVQADKPLWVIECELETLPGHWTTSKLMSSPPFNPFEKPDVGVAKPLDWCMKRWNSRREIAEEQKYLRNDEHYRIRNLETNDIIMCAILD